MPGETDREPGTEGPGPGGPTAPPETLPDSFTITWLEMQERPRTPVPPAPMGMSLALLATHRFPEHWFLYLYTNVGAAYFWNDWLHATPGHRRAFLEDESVTLHTLFVDGVPGGFFMLDCRERGMCDLAYFGLMPEMIGRRLGSWFLMSAVDAAWQRPGVETVTVNTCSLDHPRALGLYQKVGFEPVRQETRPICG
ncbi:MAG: GNAT family N-acetyltransferase [Pseudomonadota bacterium]